MGDELIIHYRTGIFTGLWDLFGGIWFNRILYAELVMALLGSQSLATKKRKTPPGTAKPAVNKPNST